MWEFWTLENPSLRQRLYAAFSVFRLKTHVIVANRELDEWMTFGRINPQHLEQAKKFVEKMNG